MGLPDCSDARVRASALSAQDWGSDRREPFTRFTERDGLNKELLKQQKKVQENNATAY